MYLTSKQTSATTTYSYEGLRRWTMAGSFGYSQLTPINQSIGKYSNYMGGFGVTYLMAHSMHMAFRYDYRHYTTSNDFYMKDSQRITLGVVWSPGEQPLAIW